MAGTSQIDDVLFRSGGFPYDLKMSPVSDSGLSALVFDETLPTTQADEDMIRSQKEAESKMRLMKRKIDDQLAESRAVEHARAVTFSAALYGTGALASPVVVRRTRNIWKRGKEGAFTLTQIEEDTPSVEALDIWDCWPDPDCDGDVQKGIGFFRRQSYSLSSLQALYAQVFGTGKSSGDVDSDRAMACKRSSAARAWFSAALPATASIRRTPDPRALSPSR
jgi:hypothetical protein